MQRSVEDCVLQSGEIRCALLFHIRFKVNFEYVDTPRVCRAQENLAKNICIRDVKPLDDDVWHNNPGRGGRGCPQTEISPAPDGIAVKNKRIHGSPLRLLSALGTMHYIPLIHQTYQENARKACQKKSRYVF